LNLSKSNLIPGDLNFTSTSKRTNPLTVIIALALGLGVLWLAYDIIQSEEQHPIQEFLFGYEEEGFVFYPVSHRNSFFAIVGLVMVLLLVVYGMLVQQGKTARKLKEQNRMITLSNEKITASIHYAQRIQQSLLPKEVNVKAGFGDAFVLYQPRDIVSGDFFWMFSKGDLRLIAAIDCTGHGVPGAFLTILAHRGLNKIVNEKGLTTPARILFELHREIMSALGQKENQESGDGMEVALCVVNQENKTLTFSGANLPLFHATKNGIHKIKGDRFWIGSPVIPLGGPNPFHEKQITFESGDVFYMFSDGYADQFGGEQNRKFLSSNLLKLFPDIHSFPLEQQKKLLEKKLADWRGSNPQTDDILGIGVRV